MSDQTIIYVLAALGWLGVVLTQIRRRSTTMGEWFKENRWGLGAGLVASGTLMLIGPGDNVDLGSYVARTWAAGLAGTAAYLTGGNTPSPNATLRRKKQRVEIAHEVAAEKARE
jgi:hypothetical protein